MLTLYNVRTCFMNLFCSVLFIKLSVHIIIMHTYTKGMSNNVVLSGVSVVFPAPYARQNRALSFTYVT
jgi:hypothetical protein